MAKKSKRPEQKSHHVVQNAAPSRTWCSIDEFWTVSVKNGSPALLNVFKAHLKALGTLNKPDKWTESAIHFGIPIEK